MGKGDVGVGTGVAVGLAVGTGLSVGVTADTGAAEDLPFPQAMGEPASINPKARMASRGPADRVSLYLQPPSNKVIIAYSVEVSHSAFISPA